jgi:hypothetical protein
MFISLFRKKFGLAFQENRGVIWEHPKGTKKRLWLIKVRYPYPLQSSPLEMHASQNDGRNILQDWNFSMLTILIFDHHDLTHVEFNSYFSNSKAFLWPLGAPYQIKLKKVPFTSETLFRDHFHAFQLGQHSLSNI